MVFLVSRHLPAFTRMPPPQPPAPPPPPLGRLRRLAWCAAGLVSLGLGIVGLFLPLLPTTPLVLLAAFCFSRGSERYQHWLLNHPQWGPMVQAWRTHRAVPLRAKRWATAMMALSCALTFWLVPLPWSAFPPMICGAVAVWLWRLPNEAR